MTQKRLIKMLEIHKSKISKERDKMRDLLCEIDAMDEANDRAIDALCEAIDALSCEV